MSSNQQSSSYSTFQSTSYSSVTDSSGTTRAQQTYSDPSGTTVRRAEKLPGEEAKFETREFDSGGRRVESGGSAERGRMEDVSGVVDGVGEDKGVM